MANGAEITFTTWVDDPKLYARLLYGMHGPSWSTFDPDPSRHQPPARLRDWPRWLWSIVRYEYLRAQGRAGYQAYTHTFNPPEVL